MTRELYAPAIRQVAYREVKETPLAAGQIRVRAEYGAFKHGTELTLWRNSRGDPNWSPIELGNMLVGRVTEVGAGVTGFAVDDRACAYSSMCESVVWNAAEAWKLPEGMDWKAAVCLDPADFALAGVRDGHVRVGDDVAVFGLGAIGLFVVQLSKLGGARRIAAVDPIARRREIAKNFGADLVVDPTAGDPGGKIKKYFSSRGADVSIDISGNYSALHQAIRSVAFGGNVVAVAWPSECKGGLDLGAEAHGNRPTLIFARACSDPNRDHPRWSEGRIFETLKGWFENGTLKAGGVVDPVVPFEQAGEAWLRVDRDAASSVKLGVSFQG